MNTKAAIAILILISAASAVECPPGFVWQRMSGIGCVQEDCWDVSKPHSHLGYTGYCLCGTDDCVGDPFCEGCYEPVDYSGFDKTKCGNFCPGHRLVACVKIGQPCPNKATTTTTTKATTTTTKAATTTTQDPLIQSAQTAITLPTLSVPSLLPQQQNQTPKNESCLDFGVQPKDFDLTYDDKELRKEFMDFLDEYMKNNKVYSASERYAGWHPVDFAALGFFMFTEDMNYSRSSRFWTGNENTLQQSIRQRFMAQNRSLTPSEIFEEALRANGNCVMDALLCTHNYLKTEVYEAREVRRNAQKLIDADTEQMKAVNERLMAELRATGHLTEDGEIIESSHMSDKYHRLMAELTKLQDRIDENKKIKADAGKAFFDQLQQLRRSDNEGAWYHLFGTLTTGYAERENTWTLFANSGYTRIELWGEHRIYKGFRRSGGIDLPEYCWDVWGGYLGGELYSKTGANKDNIRQLVLEDTSKWMDLSEMGYVKDGYSGRHIYK